MKINRGRRRTRSQDDKKTGDDAVILPSTFSRGGNNSGAVSDGGGGQQQQQQPRKKRSGRRPKNKNIRSTSQDSGYNSYGVASYESDASSIQQQQEYHQPPPLGEEYQQPITFRSEPSYRQPTFREPSARKMSGLTTGSGYAHSSDDGSSINSFTGGNARRKKKPKKKKAKGGKGGGFRNFFPGGMGGGGGGSVSKKSNTTDHSPNGENGDDENGSNSFGSNNNPPKELEYNSSDDPYSNFPIPQNQYYNPPPPVRRRRTPSPPSIYDNHDNHTLLECPNPEFHGTEKSMEMSLQINNNKNDSNSDSDSSDDYDDEFFLGGGSGHNDNNLDNLDNEPDLPDYSRGKLIHQKEVAALNLDSIEKIARKNSTSSNKGSEEFDIEKYPVKPDYAYKDQRMMSRRQLRNEMNTKSSYYHDMRLLSETKKEIGQLHLEVLQCFGLPTSSLIKEVSAYSVAVHGHSAFQTDIIPNVANPMWLSKMRRACLFPIRETYSKLYIGIFDLEATIDAPPETIKGHPGHPGWVAGVGNGGNGGDHHQQQQHQQYGSGAFNDGPRRKSGGHWNDDNNDDDDNEDDLGPQPAPYCTKAEDFIGHVIIDICRLRPGSTYDVTLPLRRSTQVFTREPQGSVRVRLHLNYNSERSAVLSYLPKSLPGGTIIMDKQPNMRYTVNCVDDRSARNVAHAVHGIHMSGKFNLDLVKSTIREITWTRIHILRYLRKRELYQLTTWVYPSISGFVFLAWMHGVYANTVRYVPGHIVVFLLLHLIKNYAYYAMDSPLQNGFLGPTIEELYWALMRGTKKRTSKNKNPFIEPLTVERDVFGSETELAMSGIPGPVAAGADGHGGQCGIANKNLKLMDELYDENGNLVHASRVPLNEIADAMRKSLKVQSHRKGFHVFKHSFQGNRAVDFLCEHGYAFTRPEAVQLGRRLQNEKRLFQHISEGEHFSFEDSPFVYHFLEYDSQRYVIKESHVPKGGRILELLGFYSRGGHGNNGGNDSGGKGGDNKSKKKRVVGGADILESREHVEFPFSTGVDHPRFTVKESLVIRSIEVKERIQREEVAKAMVEVAEFGIVPTASTVFTVNNNHNASTTPGNTASRAHNGGASGYDSERDTSAGMRARSFFRGSGSVGASSAGSVDDLNARRGYGYNTNDAAQQIGGAAADGARLVGRTVRRGSLLVGTAVTSVATTVAAGAGAVTQNLTDTLTGGTRGQQNMMASANMLEVATNEEMYKKLRDQNNAELDKVLELQRQADEYDPLAYDSDTDVGNVHRRKRKKFIIVEKHLKKPMTQEIGGNSNVTQIDMSLAKALQKGRRQVNALFYHMFDDQVYKIDKNLFPTRLDEKTEKDLLLDAIKKKKKRGLFNRRVSAQELQEEEERHKRLKLTPYERHQDEMDKVLLINQYSHSNPWINRVAVVIQPLVEMAQTFLFAIRALFNVFTWQDPVLCFWLCFLGPILALVLYIAPYRILFGILGIYIIGPQNYVLRLYRETRSGYKPPDFDTIVKKKKIEKVEDFREMQFFSSEAPGNQQIRFRNIDPTQVKQIVVPSNMLMYNRFYDWPPEPEYARVYASPPPRNLATPGFADENDENGYESDSVFTFDAASRNNVEVKKKKKKGFKKVASRFKKGTRSTIGFVENAGGKIITGADNVVNKTTTTTVGAVKGSAAMTKNVVKGTGKHSKSAAKGTANFLRLRKKNKNSKGKYSDDEDEYY